MAHTTVQVCAGLRRSNLWTATLVGQIGCQHCPRADLPSRLSAVHGEGRSSMDAALQEAGKTVRYALGSNQRTARLAMLITLLGVLWWLIML
jgi:hypothetical protein